MPFVFIIVCNPKNVSPLTFLFFKILQKTLTRYESLPIGDYYQNISLFIKINFTQAIISFFKYLLSILISPEVIEQSEDPKYAKLQQQLLDLTMYIEKGPLNSTFAQTNRTNIQFLDDISRCEMRTDPDVNFKTQSKMNSSRIDRRSSMMSILEELEDREIIREFEAAQLPPKVSEYAKIQQNQVIKEKKPSVDAQIESLFKKLEASKSRLNAIKNGQL